MLLECARSSQPPSETARSELRAPVRVKYEFRPWGSSHERSAQRLPRQFGVELVTHRPSDHLAREQIEHHH
jgi:hypothetical protein